MASINGKIDKVSENVRRTLQSLTNEDSPTSYAYLDAVDDDLPQTDEVINDMFRKNSHLEKDSTTTTTTTTSTKITTEIPSTSTPLSAQLPAPDNSPIQEFPNRKAASQPISASHDQPKAMLRSDPHYMGTEMPKRRKADSAPARVADQSTSQIHVDDLRIPIVLDKRRQVKTTHDMVRESAIDSSKNPKESPEVRPETPPAPRPKPLVSILKQKRVKASSSIEQSNSDQDATHHVTFNVTIDETLPKGSKVKNRRPTRFEHQHSGVSGSSDADEEITSIDEPMVPSGNEYGSAEKTGHSATTEDYEPQGSEPQNEKEKLLKWDVFRSTPRSEDDETKEFFLELMRKLFKVVTIFVCFVVVCGGALIHKATVLFAASQVDNSYNYTCVRYNNTNINATKTDFYKCVRQGFPKEYGDSVPSCIRSDFTRISDITQEHLCVDIQARWIWCLVLIIATPEVFVFIRCLFKVSLKREDNPKLFALFVMLLTETLSLLGTCCFVFVVLPSMKSSVHGLALMAAVGFLPSLLNVLKKSENRNKPKKNCLHCTQRLFDVIAMLCQLSGMVVWPVMIGFKLMPDFDQSLMWSIPLSLCLMSLTWWVNYIEDIEEQSLRTYLYKDDASPQGWRQHLFKLKVQIDEARTKIYLLVSVSKMIIVMCGMFFFACVYQKIPFKDLFNLNRNVCDGKLTAQDLPGQNTDWVFLWLVNLLIAITSYFCARAATKVWIQFQSFAMPLILVTPILTAVLIYDCHAWVFDNCHFDNMVPEYLAFDCRLNTELLDIVTKDYIWVLYVWWLAQLWVTRHIWFDNNNKLAKTSLLFFNPLYGGVVHEQWLLYNRCPKDQNVSSGKTVPKNEDETLEKRGIEVRKEIEEQRNQDEIPMIYICATMWHETKTEMNNMLESIFRLDMDQCTRRIAQDVLGVRDRDFYKFEAHIFFDDCMNRGKSHTMFNYVVNDFVADLVSIVDDAASIIYKMNISVPPPTKYPTPYGGRLVWTMPGGNQIICHLKDKEKIRVKKRWSQVMYMYYFLGYKLFSQELSSNRKQIKADNTFLLALDGDVDFKPGALQLLVDIMKKDIEVGAACGRIHPTGSGPMVWYQKFEYAMGHWMQKATEHVLGCVLCSPGCFSLFRGSAIMDDNVMQRYTTTSEEARHLIQYDQGEDRWLCTLLLQQGHRVEYSAASDSYTFAPEAFEEFYKQRRRWTPSTMANVMDLLSSWKHTVKENNHISMLYIAYQFVLLISSLLGAGTIFLMIVGALSVAIKIDNTLSFILNAIPLVLYIIICLTMKEVVQLAAANILTVAYGLIQILVLIALIIQMVDEKVGSPTFIFFAYVAGTILFAAILHPQEFPCVFPGLLYFILVPSMYMLLMIYSLTNINNVSWGTREVKQTKSQKEQEEFLKTEARRKQREEEAKNLKKEGTLERFKDFMRFKNDNSKEEDGWTLGFGNCFRFTCCPRPEDKTHLNRIFDRIDDQTALIKRLDQRVETLTEDNWDGHDQEDLAEEAGGLAAQCKTMSTKRKKSRNARKVSVLPEGALSAVIEDEDEEETEEEKKEREEADREREAEYKKDMLEKELTDPEWIKDSERLGTGPIDYLPQDEQEFFKDIIQKYLSPLIKDEEKEEKVNMELASLKNKVSFGYILLNTAFVVVIFTLQAHKEKLSITWPWGDDLKLEPIGLMFLIFFVVIMSLQTVGMVTHRVGTFLHLVANTQLMTTITDNQSMVSNLMLMMSMMNMTETIRNDDDLKKHSRTESEYKSGGEVRPSGRKSIIYQLDKSHAKDTNIPERRPTVFLEDNLHKILDQIMDDVHDESVTPESQSEKYKHSSIFQRRKSTATFQFLRKQTLNHYNSFVGDTYEEQGYTQSTVPFDTNYYLVNEGDSSSPPKRRSNARNNNCFFSGKRTLSPPGQYDDGSVSDAFPLVGENESGIQLTVIRPTNVKVHHPPADYE